MITQAETNSEEPISSNRNNIEELEIKIEFNNKIQIELPNDEALDIQINYLQSSIKNLLYPIIQEEAENNISKSILMTSINNNINNNINNSKIIEEGINLYLQNVYDKHYLTEMENMIKTINNKISYINDKNKEYLQNKKFIERETNTVTQEKIEYFNEKENLDKELELLAINCQQNNINQQNNSINSNNIIEDINIKNKKLENLKNKYNKIFEDISANKKEYPIIKNKNSMIQGENMILNEKLKQKQIIWEQLRKKNEDVKGVVIKRQYSNVEIDNINNKNDINDEKEKDKKAQSKNLKISKMGTFLKGFMGNG